MALASTGLGAYFSLSGNVTLTGTAVVTMSDSLGNSIRGGAASRLTNDVGIRFKGRASSARPDRDHQCRVDRGQPADRAGDQSEPRTG